MRMRDLHELSLGERIMLTVAIALVILFALALAGYLSGRWDDQSRFSLQSFESSAVAQTLYEDIAPDPILLGLDRRALEEAYHARLIRLFDIYLTTQDDTAFTNGLKIARRGYVKAATALTKREIELHQQEQSKGSVRP